MNQGLSNNIKIRRGYGEDIAMVMSIMNVAFNSEYGEAWNGAQCISMLSLPFTQLLIAEYNGETCGFAFTRGVCDDEELLMLATRPEKRRTGIATALMKHIINYAIKNGRAYIFLEMRKGNSAETFYEKFGFKQIGTRKKYYRGFSGQYYDAITKRILL